MITTGDIKNILLKAVKANPVLGAVPEIVKDKHKPVTEDTVAERIVIVANASDNEDWQNGYYRICVYVPDLKKGYGKNQIYKIPDAQRLNELEHVCKEMFYRTTLTYIDEETVYYKQVDIVTEEDSETWSHFLNVRLKVTNSNFKL
jgi:hypothetical protein